MADKKNDEKQLKIQTKSDYYKFHRALKDVPRKGARFSYAVAKNFRVVDQEINDMEEAIKPTEVMKKYNTELDQINKKYARKDPLGKFVLIPGIINGEKVNLYDIEGKDIDGSPYEKDVAKLKLKNKKEIDAHQKKVDDYNATMNDKVEFSPFMINFADVPDEAGPWIFNLEYMIKNVENF